VAGGALFSGNFYDSSRLEVRGSAAFSPPMPPSGVDIAMLGSIGQRMVMIQIRNWSLQPAVKLDVAGILERGEDFALYHPYDLLGALVTKGVYNGTPIVLSMRPIAPPNVWVVNTRWRLPAVGEVCGIRAGACTRPSQCH